jgi:hypothetical protein
MTEAQTMLELADKLRSFSKEELIEELLGALQRAAAAAAQPVAWCQPMDCGKNTPRKFMIYFEDPDHGIMVFDNEVEARAAFDRKNTAWNCYLFGAMPLHVSASTIPADTQAMREALEKIIAVPTGYHAAAQMESIARAALAATGHRAGGEDFTQCEKCWQPATCKKYGCREPVSVALSRPQCEGTK